MQMPNVDSRKRLWQEQHQQQHQQQHRHHRSLNGDVEKITSNRLDVSEDGSSAHCLLVGLQPFDSALIHRSYRNSLAIQLAIRHLNQGNGTLVTELSGLPNSCPIRFSAAFADTRRDPLEGFSAVDAWTRKSPLTSTDSFQNDDLVLAGLSLLSTNSTLSTATPQMESSSIEIIVEATAIQNNTTGAAAAAAAADATLRLPCAFVGAMDSQISKTTALVTGLRGFPQISPGSTSKALTNSEQFPLFGRTVPDDSFGAETFVRFLHDTLGVRHIFVIFESHAFTRSIVNSMKDAIRNLGWSFNRLNSTNNVDDNEDRSSNIMYMEDKIIELSSSSSSLLKECIDALKNSEYRFVVALTADPTLTDMLMESAYEQGVVGTPDGSYHWWFFSGTLEATLSGRKFPTDSILAKAYQSVGVLGFNTDKSEGSRYELFLQQSLELKRELYKVHDIDEASSNSSSSNSSVQKKQWLFAKEAPWLNENEWLQVGGDDYFSAGFAYDATVLLGLGACNAVAEKGSSDRSDNRSSLFLTGSEYFETIKRTNFTGITGDVVLDPKTGTRDGRTIQNSIDNWLSFDNNNHDDSNTNTNNTDTNATVTFRSTLTHVYESGGDGNWVELHPFVFNGGKTIATLGPNPGLPPVVVSYKETDTWIVSLSISLAIIVFLASIGCAIWTCLRKESRVIRASQPFFLLLLCLGIALIALSIIPRSLQHSVSITSQVTCKSYIGLILIGFTITFSTLFAKTLRINKIMDSAKKFKRIKLSVADTLYPVAIMLLFDIIIFTAMVLSKPVLLTTIVTEYDRFDRPNEMYVFCCYTDVMPYVATMLAVALGMVCLALFQAWRARNLSTEFAESQYIANVLLIALIVLILVVPVLLLTRLNPNIDTFVHAMIITVIASTTLGFIFVPKMMMHYNSQQKSQLRPAPSAKPIRDSERSRLSTIISLLSHSSHGEKILTTKPSHKLASELKILERELVRLKKVEKTLTLRNASLQQRIEEVKNGEKTKYESGESGTTDVTSPKGGSVLSNETFECNDAISSVMKDEDSDSLDSIDQFKSLNCLDKTTATTATTCAFNEDENGDLDDSEKADVSDLNDLESNL